MQFFSNVAIVFSLSVLALQWSASEEEILHTGILSQLVVILGICLLDLIVSTELVIFIDEFASKEYRNYNAPFSK